MSRRGPRIGIVAPYGWVGTVPSLEGLVQFLADHGYGVDIYCCQDDAFPRPSFPGRDVDIYILPGRSQPGQSMWRWRFLVHWVPYLALRYRQERYGCVIGIDPWGLVLASVPATIWKIPVIYHSLELIFWDEITSVYLKLLKLLERQCNRLAAFTITQDKDRAALLMAENRITEDRIAYLPNAPSGEAKVERSDYLHQVLGIAHGRPIVLHLGSVQPFTLALELARAAKRWDSSFALVFHTRHRPKDEYGEAFLREIDGRHVYVSDKPVEAQRVRHVVAAADVGLALYAVSARRKNVYTMGLSSGKIAHYLQCGKPVIASDLPTVKRYIEGYGCGVCVPEVDDVPWALNALLDEYTLYSENASKCFAQEFCLDRYRSKLLERVEQITSGQS